MKKTWTVRVTTSETNVYHVYAETPEEAKTLLLSGDYDPYEMVDASIDDVEVIGEGVLYFPKIT